MSERERIDAYYCALLERHGTKPEAVDVTREGQRLRFGVLLDALGESHQATILDVGCGYGAFKDFLIENGRWSAEYTGVDLCAGMVERALGLRPNTRFSVRDIRTQPFGKPFDFVVASGIFQLDLGKTYMREMLDALWTHTGRRLAFNMLSKCADAKTKGEAYHDPGEILRLCLKLSASVILRHEYRKNDFTVIMSRDGQDR